ncbi:aromatic amino acid lyase [Thermoactinospora rubra]|uniref:aromatic amino acid lyase n=1 Tax=Thermoactinospora rubra TaxID=1088767 RepID=UPI000A110EAB|nr:aromatic amino acid lyase [Thermoactinospora rubra]
MSAPVELTGAGLTCAQVHRIGYGGAGVVLGSADRARRAWESARALAGPVYGRTTGVGANKDVTLAEGGWDVLRSHAGGAGPPVPEERARAMLAVRINQLLVGGSGVDPGVLPVLAEAVNGGFTPPVRRYGAIGTGDLTALATTALCLLGEVAWRGPSPAGSSSVGPSRAQSSPAGPRFALASGDALPFISSGAATLADAAIACHELSTLLGAAAGVAARSFAAVGASAEPLARAVQQARPHPGQARAAAELRDLVAGGRARVQDPYGYRAFPQVHGTALETAERARQAVETDMNAATENPLIAESSAWHNGNFHGAPVAVALDSLRAAVVGVAQLSTARLATLMEPAYTGKPPFLADRAGGSGAMILEYVAQDALAELRHLAGPVSTGTAVISRGVEDHASFATQAARLALRCAEPLEVVLACEAVAARRALGEAGPDRPLDGDLARARAALRSAEP